MTLDPAAADADPTQGESGQEPDRGYDIVLLAASAGGLAAISAVLGDLPADFPVPVVIVQHLDPRHSSMMAEILRRRTPLRVEEARDGARVEAGTVYIAPPDEHLLVMPDGHLSLSHSDPSTSCGPRLTSCSSPLPSRSSAGPSASSCGHRQRCEHGGARPGADGEHRHRPGPGFGRVRRDAPGRHRDGRRHWC